MPAVIGRVWADRWAIFRPTFILLLFCVFVGSFLFGAVSVWAEPLVMCPHEERLRCLTRLQSAGRAKV